MGQQLSLAINLFNQNYFIPQATLTEANLPSQRGKVHIVTGGYSGIGKELVKILYQKDATVYIFGRNEQNAIQAIEEVKGLFPASEGRLEFINIDLSDLRTVKPAAEAFLSKESRLDVLTNNAGILFPPRDLQSAQGYELQLCANCLGHFVLMKCLFPILKSTAATSPSGSVRVTWAGSIGVDLSSPKNGILWDESTGAPKRGDHMHDYSQAKVGNVYLSSELARRHGRDGVMSLAFQPGHLSSPMQRHLPGTMRQVFDWFVGHPVHLGAYTELFAGWKELSESDNGAWIIPWGRIGWMRSDITANLRGKEEGGLGGAEKFWDWCEQELKEYY
ncbi:NAD(P)-binding protein [Rhizodiscina lignyota]|uniref:NAD(P)-binding protein n=1 Tax=Rhizodiscina lignyota TaxID=1504668 RepID=A0A9P4MAU8_9PEZI|nr:NAD(P)-binding protein [Rhizodiscina lignyota]